MRRRSFLIAIAPLIILACAGAPKQKESVAAGNAAGDARPEVSQVMRRPPARPRASATSLLEPALNAAAVARSAQAERDAAAKAAEEKAAADKAARDAAAADKAAVDKAAADKAAADKAAADKAAADKAAADKAAEKAAAEKKAAADKAAADKAAADKKSAAGKTAAEKKGAADKAAAKAKSEPAPASPGTPAIKSAPASQAIVVDPAADRGPDISRRVSTPEGSRFDLDFEGTGWTYLGDKDGKDGVLYGSRRFEGASVVFTLNAVKAGEYVLRFQRQDALRGISYEDRIGVTVAPRDKAAAAASGSPATSATSQAATPAASPAAATATATPATASTAASPAAAAKGATPAATSSAKPAAAASTAPAASAAAPAPAAGTSATPAAALPASAAATAAAAPAPNTAAIPDTPEGMLLFAREELAAGRPQGAIEALDRLLARYPAGMDEAFYLYGLALEQSGPLKDIKRAYSYYKMVRDDYPESSFWEKASSRIGYIERHYFEIR